MSAQEIYGISPRTIFLDYDPIELLSEGGITGDRLNTRKNDISE